MTQTATDVTVLAWPDADGWWWCRNGEGLADIVKSLDDRVYGLKNHRDAHYDQYETWMTQEEYREYGDCEFVKLEATCPWK